MSSPPTAPSGIQHAGVHRRRPSLHSIVTSPLDPALANAVSPGSQQQQQPSSASRRRHDKEKDSDPDDIADDFESAALVSPSGREKTRFPVRRGTRKGSKTFIPEGKEPNSTVSSTWASSPRSTAYEQFRPSSYDPPGVMIPTPTATTSTTAFLDSAPVSNAPPSLFHPHPHPHPGLSSTPLHRTPRKASLVGRASSSYNLASSAPSISNGALSSAPTSGYSTPSTFLPLPPAYAAVTYPPTDGNILPLTSARTTPFHTPLPSPNSSKADLAGFFDGSSASPRSSTSLEEYEGPAAERRWRRDDIARVPISLATGRDKGREWARWWKKKKNKAARISNGGVRLVSAASGDGARPGWLRGRWIPQRKETMCFSLLLFLLFAVSLTRFLCWALNPDKAALPWKRDCLSPHPSYHAFTPQSPTELQTIPLPSFDSSTSPVQPVHPLLPHPLISPSSLESEGVPPIGLFVGVFSTDKAFERRQMIRTTYARKGSGGGADGLQSVRVRFILGRPKPRYKALVELEMEAYGDIVVLDIQENMNSGKTHAFFAWAAVNAMVPESLSAAHASDGTLGEKRPDYVSKADDDSFIMLGELEKRLRVLGGNKIYWGYLVKNQFMGGECYALSLDLVRFVSTSPAVRKITWGAEDKLVARWMRLHPESSSILWVSDRCWIYDHPKAGTVYSHGFLFPSTVRHIRQQYVASLGLDDAGYALSRSTSNHITASASSLTYSSVSQFGHPYRPPLPNLTPAQRIEALIEGSELSLLSPYSSSSSSSPLLPETVMARRPSLNERYEGQWGRRWGAGTVVVHYIKEREWFLETALAFLGDNARLGGGPRLSSTVVDEKMLVKRDFVVDSAPTKEGEGATEMGDEDEEESGEAGEPDVVGETRVDEDDA